jgi:hypothetical protein
MTKLLSMTILSQKSVQETQVRSNTKRLSPVSVLVLDTSLQVSRRASPVLKPLLPNIST